MMLGVLATVILDAFSGDRCDEMAEAIDEICPPQGGGPFASSGLYAFWNRESRDLLYLGLARDLGYRFRQHVGLFSCDPKGCKVEQIRGWFGAHELLGYSLLPQSPFDQADCARARAAHGQSLEARALPAELAASGEEEIVAAEGQLLQASVIRDGHLPLWNTYGGSTFGAARATVESGPMLDFMRARYRHALTSRLPIRELAQKPLAGYFESLLHVARWNMLLEHGGGDDALLRAEVERLAAEPELSGSSGFRWILECGYLD